MDRLDIGGKKYIFKFIFGNESIFLDIRLLVPLPGFFHPIIKNSFQLYVHCTNIESFVEKHVILKIHVPKVYAGFLRETLIYRNTSDREITGLYIISTDKDITMNCCSVLKHFNLSRVCIFICKD